MRQPPPRLPLLSLLVPLLPLTVVAFTVGQTAPPAHSQRPISAVRPNDDNTEIDYGYAPFARRFPRAWSVLLRQEYGSARRRSQAAQIDDSLAARRNAEQTVRAYNQMADLTSSSQLAALHLPRSLPVLTWKEP